MKERFDSRIFQMRIRARLCMWNDMSGKTERGEKVDLKPMIDGPEWSRSVSRIGSGPFNVMISTAVASFIYVCAEG